MRLMIIEVSIASNYEIILWIIGITIVLVVGLLLLTPILVAWAFISKFKHDIDYRLQPFVEPFMRSEYIYNGVSNKFLHSSITFKKEDTKFK